MVWMGLLVGVAAAGAPTIPLDAVVLVEQGSSVCAGAFIDAEARVATAYHCVAAGGRPHVTNHAGEHFMARVVGVDVAADVALLEVDGADNQAWIALASGPPAVGAPVYVVGHPFGVRAPQGFMEGTLRWATSAGVLAAVGPRALQITAPVNPGNSGGPVLDEQMRLIGVVSRRLTGDGMGFAGRGERVSALLARSARRLSAIGGTIEAGLLLNTLEGVNGTASVGGRLQLVARDRVVFSMAGSYPLALRWDALRYGAVRWVALEPRLGLRQRLGWGSWTTRVEVYGGLAQLQTARGDRDTLQMSQEGRLVPIVGGELALGSVGFDMGWLPRGGELRGSVILRWPGVLTVF